MATALPTISLAELEKVQDFVRNVVESEGRAIVDGVERTLGDKALIEACASISQLAYEARAEAGKKSSFILNANDPLFSALASLTDLRTSAKCAPARCAFLARP